MSKTMPTLFWQEKDPGDALEHIKCAATGSDAQIFLHGVCGIFALALHEEFNYTVTVYAEPVEEDYEPISDRIIHIYCQHEDKYIDVRGITTDKTAFLDEFADFTSSRAEWDDVIEHFPITDLTDMVNAMMAAEEFNKYMADAKTLIAKYRDGYSIKEEDKALVTPIGIRASRAEKKKQLEEKYVGKRIRLIRMAVESDSPYNKAPYIREPGEEGFCVGVDDGPHLLMRWDCGSSLRLLPDVDEFEVI